MYEDNCLHQLSHQQQKQTQDLFRSEGLPVYTRHSRGWDWRLPPTPLSSLTQELSLHSLGLNDAIFQNVCKAGKRTCIFPALAAY